VGRQPTGQLDVVAKSILSGLATGSTAGTAGSKVKDSASLRVKRMRLLCECRNEYAVSSAMPSALHHLRAVMLQVLLGSYRCSIGQMYMSVCS
jgi:hypothetical protein